MNIHTFLRRRNAWRQVVAVKMMQIDSVELSATKTVYMFREKYENLVGGYARAFKAIKACTCNIITPSAIQRSVGANQRLDGREDFPAFKLSHSDALINWQIPDPNDSSTWPPILNSGKTQTMAQIIKGREVMKNPGVFFHSKDPWMCTFSDKEPVPPVPKELLNAIRNRDRNKPLDAKVETPGYWFGVDASSDTFSDKTVIATFKKSTVDGEPHLELIKIEHYDNDGKVIHK